MSDSSHFDVEEGQEVVRRTIVGGRPQARRAKTISVPIGIEKVLVRAAGDGAFRHRLFDDRAAAVAEVAPVLQPSEAAILRAVPDATLAVMIGHIDLPKHGSRRFLNGVVTAALASAALLGVVDCGGSSTGIQPDEPDADTVQETTIEVEETAGSRGILPDYVEGER
jgi:hypothetical protein